MKEKVELSLEELSELEDLGFDIRSIHYTAQRILMQLPYSLKKDGISYNLIIEKTWNDFTVKYLEKRDGVYGNDVLFYSDGTCIINVLFEFTKKVLRFEKEQKENEE